MRIFGPLQTTEAENFDRRELGLVGAQEQLLAAVTAVQPNTIVVLVHGGPIAIENAVRSPRVRAIVDAFQPGELGADAIMDLLRGTFSPSGLMPYTVCVLSSCCLESVFAACHPVFWLPPVSREAGSVCVVGVMSLCQQLTCL